MTSTAPSSPGRALLTGSAAPFAQRLVDRLRDLGWDVSTVVHDDRQLLPPTHSMHLPSPAPARQALADVVAEVDAVVLLSGIDSLTSMVDDSRDLDAVLGGMKPGAALVEVTTLAVFGDAGEEPVSEEAQPDVPADLDPVAACEIRVLAANDWLRGVVVRPGMVYSDGGGPALEAAIDLARSHGVSRYFGDGSETIPTVHADDLLDLLTRVIDEPSARGVYHAVSGEVASHELADLVASAAGVDRVEPWTAEALQAEFGTTGHPPRVSVRSEPTHGRAAGELDWTPAAHSLAQVLSR